MNQLWRGSKASGTTVRPFSNRHSVKSRMSPVTASHNSGCFPTTRKRTSATWPNLQFPPSLWSDPDICWLTGAHQAEGKTYFNRERYEELLWWLLMPSLMHLAGESAPITADAAQLNAAIDTALDAAEAAGYRVDVLTGAAPNIDPTIPSESSLEEQTEATNPATELKRK